MRGDAISGVLLAGLGGYAAVKAYALGLGPLSQPGAGFFPFWGGVLVVVCAGTVAAKALLARVATRRTSAALAPEATEPAQPDRWWKVAACVAVLLAYAVLLPRIGFGPSTFLMMLALTRLDPDTTWRGSFLVAGIGAAAFWLVFDYLLGVSFPSPALGF